MKKLGLGIIGCGGFSLLAREAFEELPGVEVVALADPAPERLGEALGGCPTTTGYPSHDQLLADPRVDVVAIMTPPHLHAPIAREALLAGKHIFLKNRESSPWRRWTPSWISWPAAGWRGASTS